MIPWFHMRAGSRDIELSDGAHERFNEAAYIGRTAFWFIPVDINTYRGFQYPLENCTIRPRFLVTYGTIVGASSLPVLLRPLNRKLRRRSANKSQISSTLPDHRSPWLANILIGVEHSPSTNNLNFLRTERINTFSWCRREKARRERVFFVF